MNNVQQDQCRIIYTDFYNCSLLHIQVACTSRLNNVLLTEMLLASLFIKKGLSTVSARDVAIVVHCGGLIDGVSSVIEFSAPLSTSANHSCDIAEFNLNSVLNKCSAVAEMGDYLATIDMGQKEGAVVSLSGGSWVPI